MCNMCKKPRERRTRNNVAGWYLKMRLNAKYSRWACHCIYDAINVKFSLMKEYNVVAIVKIIALNMNRPKNLNIFTLHLFRPYFHFSNTVLPTYSRSVSAFVFHRMQYIVQFTQLKLTLKKGYYITKISETNSKVTHRHTRKINTMEN